MKSCKKGEEQLSDQTGVPEVQKSILEIRTIRIDGRDWSDLGLVYAGMSHSAIIRKIIHAHLESLRQRNLIPTRPSIEIEEQTENGQQ